MRLLNKPRSISKSPNVFDLEFKVYVLVKLIAHVFTLKALDAVVEDLYRTYFATYGYAFPLTGKCMFLCSRVWLISPFININPKM